MTTEPSHEKPVFVYAKTKALVFARYSNPSSSLISSHLLWGTARFVLEQVANAEDRFSHEAA